MRCAGEGISDRLVAVSDCVYAVVVDADFVRGELNLHAEFHMLWTGFHVDDVAPDAGAAAVHNASNVGNGYAWRCERDDCEGAKFALVDDGHFPEVVSETASAGVSSIKESCPAGRALIGN